MTRVNLYRFTGVRLIFCRAYESMVRTESKVEGVVPARPCVAIMADMIHSRTLTVREAVQHELIGLVASLNDLCRDSILAEFTVTSGDGFQALLCQAQVVPAVIWHVSDRFPYATFRFGVGHGTLSTRLYETPAWTDGPVWWAARTALQNASRTRRNGGVFAGFGSDDLLLTAFASLTEELRSRLTNKQRAVIQSLRHGNDIVQTGMELGITKQAVHKHARAAGWPALREGEFAWTSVLARYPAAETSGES